MNFAQRGAKAEAVPTIGEQDFEREVLRSELPVLLEFSAEWCQPCKTIAPEVAAFAKEMEGKINVRKIDIDRSPLIARELRIQSVPTFMMFAQGRPVDAVVGAVGKKKLREMVDPYLPRAEGALKAIEVAQLLREGRIAVVDTRDAAAFGRAHLPGASNMPIEEIETRLAELHMLPAQPVLYCRSGDKTKVLAEKLAGEGMPVMFIEGGMLGWESEGLPVERG
ncbi:MAG TPA: thioredoxin domain-containing protein [Polyangiaceae bacterium]